MIVNNDVRRVKLQVAGEGNPFFPGAVSVLQGTGVKPVPQMDTQGEIPFLPTGNKSRNKVVLLWRSEKPKIHRGEGRARSLRTPIDVVKSISAVCLVMVCLCSAFAAEINPYLDPARSSTKGTGSQLGNCRITVLGTSFWRDWMPIVSRPGPDRGSPLRAKVMLSLDNSTGAANKLSFRVAIVDDKGQSHSVPFRVMPNHRVLPDDITKSYRTQGEETKKTVAAQYDLTWNGELKPGEVREVELATADGPYLPVGSRVHLEITWTDKRGDSVTVRTPDTQIQRTD
jgi:hypothetical protein